MSSKSRIKRTYVWTKTKWTTETKGQMCPCHQNPESKGHMYGQKPNGLVCHFSYWSTREGGSEWTGKFHQSPETKKSDL